MSLPFSAIPGLKVGHAQDLEAATGCTVILTPEGVTCGVDQRGGAPGSRETDLLRPMRRIDKIHGVLVTGGSAFGLAAADGVVRWLEERGFGYDMRLATVPIVPAAVLNDLVVGSAKIRPDAAMGYAACEAAQSARDEVGTVGAGTGAGVGNLLGVKGRMKGGLGTATEPLGPNLWVGALVAVNCVGDVLDETGQIIAGARNPDGQFADTMTILKRMTGGIHIDLSSNTVIGVVATNAQLSKEEANKMAQMAHNGIARAIRPAHTMFDGDTMFAIATGHTQPADVSVIGAFAAEVTARAIVNAVQTATSLSGVVALRDL